jgi:hypothetical protein
VCSALSGETQPSTAGASALAGEFFESRWSRRPQAFQLFTSLTRKRGVMQTFLKGLILAQNERWRRGLGMQVERIPGGLLSGGSGERGSNAWVTYPGDRDSLPNGGVIPGDLARGHLLARK